MTRFSLLTALSLWFVLSGISATPVGAAEEGADVPGEKVDRIFAGWDRPDSPGAAVAVVRGGTVLYARGYGCADLDHGVPITCDTVFDIASVSKQFAGMAVAMLVDAGKVKLDNPIRDYLPEVPDFGTPITLGHLVHHTSGLRDWPGTLRLAGWRYDDVIAFDDILQWVRRQKDLNFEPGSEYSYSNTGYNLLAEMVARVEGISFRKWTARNLFHPLGMANTHFHDDRGEIVPRRARSYSPDGAGGFRAVGSSLSALGSSSLFTTINDLVKWVNNFDDGRVGGRAVIDMMERKGALSSGRTIDYAFGQSVGTYRGVETISHSGGWAGFRTYLVRFPQARLSVIVLSNLSVCDPCAKALSVAELYLADRLAPEPNVDDEEQQTAPVDQSRFPEYTGTWQLGPAWLLTIYTEDSRLMARATAEDAFPMTPKAADRFHVVAYGADIAFERSEEGKVDALIYRDIRALRVVPFEPTVHRLREFEGVFRSDELATSYTLEVRSEQLTASHPKHGAGVLVPTVEDCFKAPLGSVVFVRDEAGWVEGFCVSDKRSRRIRFDRVPLTDKALDEARREAKFRRRRIIMNNDGNDNPLEPVTPKAFLDRRTTPLAKSHVDSIFYCTGVNNLYSHPSAVSEQMGVNWPIPNKEWVAALGAQGTDSLATMIGWCKDNGREIFWSMRMNDRHDTSPRSAHLLCQWKRDNPDMLMGKLGDRFPFGGGSWSALRYGSVEVREKMFRIIEDVCVRYDVDGIELDFFRHPIYFIEAMRGDPVPREKRAAVTSLWRRVRALTDRIGRERGRPLLIAMRIPDSVGYCRAMGLDVDQWLAEGLIDVVVGGGYFKLEPWENLVALGKKYDVPVYAAFVRRRIEPNAPEPEGSTALEVWRGEALLAWRAGVNGIYTFNRFVPTDPIFRELGDPELLETLDHVKQTAYDENCTWSNPQTWLKDGDRFVKRPND